MPQLIQYLCPSWRLSLYGRPSALSRWSDRPVLQYDRAQLVRLNVEEDSTETLVWEGSAQELQDLQDILQNYIQDLLQRSHQAFVAAEGRFAKPERVEQRSVKPVATEPDTEISLAPETIPTEEVNSETFNPETFSPELSPEIETLPLMRVESIGLLEHSLFLPPDITLSLSTLECFDLAEVLDQWQAETLNLPNLPQKTPATIAPWLKTAAIILVTVGVSSSASVLGVKWWQQQELEIAQSQTNASDLTLENLAPLPGLEDGTLYTPVPRLPSEFYGPPAPGQPDVSLGLEIQGESPLPNGNFAGLSMPPPPDFSALPPPPPYSASSGESYRTYGPDPGYSEPSSTSDNYASDNYAYAGSRQDSQGYSEETAANFPSIPTAPATERAALPDVSQSAAKTAPAPAELAPPAQEDNSARLGQIAGYFQGRWQPPGNLTGSLEYQLLIGSDGTLQAISPLSDRAGNFLDRTGIPLLGESIASPGSELWITIVFYPQGGVDVF